MTASFTHKPTNHPQNIDFGRQKAVLLVNLGTPDATDYWSMRRYLKEFLSDRRVIDAPRLLWWFILNIIILTFRPSKSGHAYAAIWDKKHNASPLRVITESQTHKLQKRLGKQTLVRHAMRYGTPGIDAVMTELENAGVGEIAVIPLYPQYAGATIGSVMDAVAEHIKARKWPANVRFCKPYYDAEVYLAAIQKGNQRRLSTLDWQPDCVVASFHGLPLRYCLEGDPYYCHCHKTARLLAERMGAVFCRSVKDVVGVRSVELGAQKKKKKVPPLLLTFQSRFGREEWLQPYTASTVEELARAGVTKLAVVCPGFAADCVETLEEIALGVREAFMAAGGTHFEMIPCLNDSEEGMDVIEALVREEL